MIVVKKTTKKPVKKKKASGVARMLKSKGVQVGPKRTEGTVWQGPLVDGITQSLIGRFLVCRERFRLLTVYGIQPQRGFEQRIEYGNMWHCCEEAWAKSGNPIVTNPAADAPWVVALTKLVRELCRKYPLDQEVIVKWFNVCKLQFPIYVAHCKRQKGFKANRRPIAQEVEFRIPYLLPSGRTVYLRGKWDSVDLLGTGSEKAIWLQENKTKGDANEEAIRGQLRFDTQTMTYRVCADEITPEMWSKMGLKLKKGKVPYEIAGVVYNVIKRPLAGGKGTIRRHKATKTKSEETWDHYYGRLATIIKEDEKDYFKRWQVEIDRKDIERFKAEFLNPVLEQICDWWEWVSSPWGLSDPFGSSNVRFGTTNEHADEDKADGPIAYPGIHYRTPYGVYNPLLERGATEVDDYLATGSEVGLERTDNLFPELSGAET